MGLSGHPLCVRCGKIVDRSSGKHAGDGGYLITFECHGEVDYVEFDRYLVRALGPLDIRFCTAFAGKVPT